MTRKRPPLERDGPRLAFIPPTTFAAGANYGAMEGQSRMSSRREPIGGRNDRGARPETMEDHDRRFCQRQPLTWRFSPASTSSISRSSFGDGPVQICTEEVGRTRVRPGSDRAEDDPERPPSYRQQ